MYTGSTRLGTLRDEYRSCSQSYGHVVEVEAIDWSILRSFDKLPFTAQFLKPMSGDLRHMTRHKFLIYLSGNAWSTTLKCVISSGAAVFLPTHFEHESYTDIVLRECADCFLYYDPRNVCSSVVLRLTNLADDDAKGYAERLSAFVKERFTLSNLLQFSKEQLTITSKSRPFPNHTLTAQHSGDALSFDDDTVLMKMSCRSIKDRCVCPCPLPRPPGSAPVRADLAYLARFSIRHAGPVHAGLYWQIESWFNSNCSLIPSPKYRYCRLTLI